MPGRRGLKTSRVISMAADATCELWASPAWAPRLRAAQGQSGRGPTPAPGEAGCWPQSQSLGGGAQWGSRLEASWGPGEVGPGLLSSSCHCCRDSFPSPLVRVYRAGI